jgi:pyruvate ferredoxin oxidoreductase beta subunit/2-oxoisovalerate ferredoxin oxidoreductase beta subunit
VELVDLAVRSGIFPLYEVFDGERYQINARPDGTDPQEYYRRQKRFADGDFDLDAVRRHIAADHQRLSRLADL